MFEWMVPRIISQAVITDHFYYMYTITYQVYQRIFELLEDHWTVIDVLMVTISSYMRQMHYLSNEDNLWSVYPLNELCPSYFVSSAIVQKIESIILDPGFVVARCDK